jgi:two-component system, cell cycle sensor histidine kinase and response regulator CckA
MNTPVRILLVDDNPDDRALVATELQREFPALEIREVFDQKGLERALNEKDFDLTITDYQLRWSNGLAVLREVKHKYPECPVIMFTSTGNEEIAVEAMKAGLDDYVLKALKHFVRLRASVRAAIEKAKLQRAQRAAEMRFRGLFDNVPIGLFSVSPVGEIIDANAALAEMLGYHSREDLIGMNARDFQVSHDDELKWITRLHEEGIIRELEVELNRPDGLTIWLRVSARAVRDDRGKTLFYQGAMEDVTERKNAEMVLRQSEERFQAFMDYSPVVAFMKDEQGRYVYVNSRWEQFFQLKIDDLREKDDLTLFDPEFVKTIRENDRKVLATNKPMESVERIRAPDGTFRTWIVIKFPVADEWGRKFAGGVCIDITERERAEEATRQSEKLFRDLFESSPDAIFVEDLQGAVLDVNPAACRLHATTRESLIGKKAVDLTPADKRDEVAREFQKLARGEMTRFESVSLAADGRTAPVAISASRFEYMGKPALLVHVRDMTEHKRLQEQFLHSQKMEAVGRLAGGIAHDFNNLLTAIIGYNALTLSELPGGHPLRKNADEIKHAADRAANLTRQLLAFSRKQTQQLRVLDFNAVVTEIEKLVRRLIGEHIELITLPGSELGRVRADRGQIEQVIVNLVVNARDAMPEGGKLIIRTGNVSISGRELWQSKEIAPGDYILLSISDTGVGITDEVKQHLFEPFFTTKEQGKGTGLGLATCYGIVEQSGGHIVCHSQPGKGTTFEIYLPRVAEPADVAARADAPQQLPTGSETILIVEDQPAVRALSARVLAMLGYSVIEAENGEHALRVARDLKARKIDLLMTDVIMPQMGGKKLVEKFLALYPQTKVLFNSGSLEDQIDLREMLSKGMAFLRKPFTPTVLARTVREVLDKAVA